jgi:hypothetical protein
MGFAVSDERPWHTYRDQPDVMFEHIAMWGTFHAVRKRRTWPEPSVAMCPVCHEEFWNGHLAHWTYRQFGPARYCMKCCLAVRTGNSRSNISKEGIIEALNELAAALDVIPSQAFCFQAFPADASDGQRDRWMRALVAMPDVASVKRVLGQKDWLGVLQAAGIVGDGWRASRGTWCRAADGHLCRSLLERSIDDWFRRNGISHQREPAWPRHPVLNPSGRKRADWLLNDGSFVECAGLMEQENYASNIEQKRELARITGITLHVLSPADMFRLAKVFADLKITHQPLG